MKDIDKYRGCLIGGAAGDALGYAVEFLDSASIIAKYGERGITEYELADGIALISDDTQMTLFTANGLLLGTTRGMTRGIMGDYQSYVGFCYKDWLRTQKEQYPLTDEWTYSWLKNVPEFFSRRAPGITCLTEIESGDFGSIEKPINSSKGCGGIMRVAPIGLYFDNDSYYADKADMIGAETAALTHGHELGYIPAAALVHIIALVAHSDITLSDAVNDMKRAMAEQFSDAVHLSEFLEIVDRAAELSRSDIEDAEAISELGEGWVAEETLAIALYCALKYSDDFDKALIASVNHSGDSDSTGAVTGNILGAYLGLKGIPQKYLDNLELKNVILEIADDLYNDCKITEYGTYRDEIWEQKYIYNNYAPKSEYNCAGGEGLPTTNKVILLPDFQKLKDEVEKLRTELSMILLERDELQFVICKNIETEYMLKLGAMEYRVYEAECKALRLKRKLELIQAKKNRMEKIIISDIEKTLDIEFSEYQEKLNAQIEKMNEAIKYRKGKFLSDDEIKECKKLYRAIVKKLHPDMNPEASNTQRELFENAVTAYKNGDLETLRMINELLGSDAAVREENGMSFLRSEAERLRSMIKKVRENITKIKSKYPYNVKVIIDSPEQIAKRKDELANVLEQYNESANIYARKINEMLR